MGTDAYGPRMIRDPQKLFSMRTDSDEGRRFLEALDRLRLAEVPQKTRTDMMKKLVFEAEKRTERRQ